MSNPGLIHRSTNNFHENRKWFTIQESFQNPENPSKSRKIFCHVILALVVSTLSQYSTSCRIRSTWSHYANGLNCNKGIEMFCHKCGKEFVSNELFCRRCIVQFLEKIPWYFCELEDSKEKVA